MSSPVPLTDPFPHLVIYDFYSLYIRLAIVINAIRSLIQQNNKFIGHNFEGKYLDCGTMHGYIKSSLEIAKS